MKTTNLTIEFDNFDDAAMADDPTGEVVRILKDLITSFETYGIPHSDGSYLKDINGNTVGNVAVEWDEEDEEDEDMEDDEDGWDGDTSMIRTIPGTYGSPPTPCDVIYCMNTHWYAVDGSVNVNQAPSGFEWHTDTTIDVETIPDVDTMTAGSPINSEEDLAELVWRHENDE